MNAKSISVKKHKRRKAMALVMVVTTVALISMLMVAIFAVTRTEYKATQNFVAARTAKQYADFAIAITEAQIQNAQNTSTSAGARTTHATQPGMVRVYNSQGSFIRAHKLYSSSKMVISGSSEAEIFSTQHQVPQEWNATQSKARWVDLNEPVIRPGLTNGTTAIYFPIIDPRAAYTGSSPTGGQNLVAVEGFSYDNKTPTVTGGGGTVTYNEVVTPEQAASNPDKLRLPMPVEWIYVLEDGTTGALDSSNKFVSSQPGKQPSATNPIVGRVAFWTDDESCKVNINTASEPTFFAPPYFYHQRDSKWANFPPTAGEYQRYPGHPATVALSAVLAPGIALDPMAVSASTTNIVSTKELIYGLMPKIATGGSQAGTRPFVNDDFSSALNEKGPATSGDVSTARSERLFASVDEMLFMDSEFDSTNGRKAAKVEIPGQSGRYLMDHDTLERSRFFLTAHSRSPEFSIHGLPRIAMWPLPDETLGTKKRTTFDNMIALCATIGGTNSSGNSTSAASIANSYIFRRAEPHHGTYDVTGSASGLGSSQGLARNTKLLDYLYSQMTGLEFPRTSSLGSGSNFSSKYGNQNVAQLAIQFFDYVRCTNLYDGVLARENDGTPAKNPKDNVELYNIRDSIGPDRYTYTEQRITPKATGSLNDGTRTKLGSDLLTDDFSVLPGHGQVTPARWTKNGEVYQGFGRMFTISEIGVQVICTADGKNDELYAVDAGGTKSGGGCAPMAVSQPRFLLQNNPLNPATHPAQYIEAMWPAGTQVLGFRRWYSNFPPLSPPYGNGAFYGCLPVPGNARHPSRHPGYNPANWNLTLQTNTPLAANEKRIQLMLSMELFCPMAGWTKMHPEWALVLDKSFMSSVKVVGSNGAEQTLFPSVTTDIVIKSNENVYEDANVYSLGGHAGPTAVSGGRSVPGWATTSIGDDTDPYQSGTNRTSSTSKYFTPPNPGHTALNNWGLVSAFVTVRRDQPLQLKFGQRDLVIKIYDKHDRAGNNGEEIQTINVSFDNMTLPVPALAYSGERRLQNDLAGTNQASKLPASAKELNHYYYVDSFGRDTYRRALAAPHWWCFNRMGCIGRMTGTVNPSYNGSAAIPFYATGPVNKTTFNGADDQMLFGRLDTDNRYFTGVNVFDNGTRDSFSLVPFENTEGWVNEQGLPWSGSDVIRTLVPAVGDYRLAAARHIVPRTMWMYHPVWQAVSNMAYQAQPRTIHSFTNHQGNTESGSVLPFASLRNNTSSPFYNYVKTSPFLVKDAPYNDDRIPDLPPSDGWAAAANAFGDFDNGIANSRDGAYINKPDEGNFTAANFTRYSQTKFYRSGYFYEPWRNSDDWRTGVYMTPNRIVTSPVMFGSLPTAVWDGGDANNSSNSLQNASVSYGNGGKPWQTLLFRPYSRSHPSLGISVNAGHPGDNNPRDHYLLDLFCMPVVEPYAISEPLSVAGRLNLNYQIVPFTNITRATGMYALMKGEFMTAIPLNDDVNNAKKYAKDSTQGTWGSIGDSFWDESTTRKFWHRPIDVEKTLYQFEQKFRHTASGVNHSSGTYRGLFRSASQICEIHLIPDVSKGASAGETLGNVGSISENTSGTQLQSIMDQFWQNHSPTGDNTRERPYANLYARVTTRSNTFRVHVRAQMVRKARSVAADTFDPAKDAVFGEYRGSALIERYIDPTDKTAAIPDYATSANPIGETPLEAFYKFRVLETKRFSP